MPTCDWLSAQDGIFNETELRLKFLQARDTYLQGILSDIPNESGELYTEEFELFLYEYQALSIPHCNFVYNMFTAGNFVYHF